MGKQPKKTSGEGKTAIAEKIKVEPPARYAVILLNDDYTPMDFVVHVLQQFFQKNAEQAAQIMINVHTKGQAVCGVYSKEIAETKAQQVVQCAQDNEYPLQCKIEKE